MEAVVTIAAKAVLGGLLVLAFAAVSETLRPKRLAGLLAAAPSVAIAGLAVGSAAKGPLQQSAAAETMVAGAVALAVFAAVAVVVLPRLGTVKGALVAGVAWAATALVLYPVVS